MKIKSKKSIAIISLFLISILLICLYIIYLYAQPQYGYFEKTGTPNYARAGHSATLLNDGRVLIAGGDNCNENKPSTAEVYDPKTGKFTMIGNMLGCWLGHKAILSNDNKVFFFNTLGSKEMKRLMKKNGKPTVEVFDPKTNKFYYAGKLKQISPRRRSVVKLNKNEVLIFGDSSNLPTAEIYNLKGNSSNIIDNLEINNIMAVCQNVLPHKNILIIGRKFIEKNEDYEEDSFLEIFDIKQKKFDIVGTSKISIAADAIKLPNEKIFTYGEHDWHFAHEILDSNTLKSEFYEKIPRFDAYSMVQLKDGNILLVGGSGTFIFQMVHTPTQYIYDYKKNNFYKLPSLNFKRNRYSTTLTVLKDGRVLLTGKGKEFESPALIPAELYIPAKK